MFLFKKKLFLYLYIFFLVLVLIFNEFSTNRAFSKNFNVTQVKINEYYDLNFDKYKVIDRAFIKAFRILNYQILEKKDQSKLNSVTLEEIKSLIENFTIIDEKFINKEYQSEFEVQFNRKKVLNFIERKNLVSSLPKKIKVFMLPVLIDIRSNELYTLDKNIFFKNWNNDSKKYFLINYVLPNEDIEDYLIISKNINNIENYNFDEIIRKYNLENYIILIVLKDNKILRIFSKIKLDKKKMLMNNFFNKININNELSINNLIMDIKDHYEDKWKSLNKINTSIALPIRLAIDSKNFELSKKLEKKLLSLDLVSDFKIEKINNKEIVYKIIYNSTPDSFLENMLSFEFKIDISNVLWKLK